MSAVVWQLRSEQVQALQAIARARGLQRLGQALAVALPSLPQRLGERLPELVALGAERAQRHGLTHLACLGRYLACWSVQGAEFETKPGHEWALALLADAGRAQGAKVFQLCRRVREGLAGTGTAAGASSAALSAEAFDQAIAQLDAALLNRGHLGALLAGEPVKLGQACDIDAVELRPLGPPAARPYAFEGGQWHLQGAPASPAALRLGPGQPWPQRLYLLASSGARQPAQLRVRSAAASVCDAATHPLLRLQGSQGVLDWRGPLALDVALQLPCAPAAPTPGALQPQIAVQAAPQSHLLSLQSCGLRDGGAALGEVQSQIDVQAQEQRLLAWRREASGTWQWPLPGGSLPMAPTPRVRLECDGAALDASAWQAGLRQLDAQLAASLGQMFAVWERESGVVGGQLQAEPRLLCGDAGVAWGWAASPQGMAQPPWLRLAAALDLVACSLNLQLSGELQIQGARSRVHLHCTAVERLQLRWERSAQDAELLPAAPALACSFSQPFVLHLEPLAEPGLGLLGHGPAAGALVGSCGLRPRADGAGLQWFAQLAVEPVHCSLHWSHPLLGQQAMHRPLLPALPLLDWSLG